MTGLAELEFGILYFFQALHLPWLDWLMVQITSLGDGGWFWIALGVLFICMKKTRKLGIAMLLSLLIGFLIGNVWMKNLFERQRPCWIDPSVDLLIHNPKDFSFPSGHSLASFEGAMSIYLYHKRWGILALILAALIAVSRLYLFVHFPSDVLVGSVLGIGIAWVVHLCYTSFEQKNKIE